MNQSEKREYLIRALLRERQEDMGIPSGEAQQRLLLRGLMNVRPPRRIGREFLDVQDAYLQQATAEKGITDENELSPIQPGLYLWQGDITTLRCDAIVNAANSGLTGCYVPNHRCIDNAIHTYAGTQLRLVCEALMARQGCPDPTGRAKLTPGFNLPCKYVLHTVGPIVGDHVTQSKTGQPWPPATGPAWSWQRPTAWKAWRSAASPLGNFTSPTTQRQKSRCGR